MLDGALTYLGGLIETAGDGTAVTVFNALSWPRTDIAHVDVELPADGSGIDLVDDSGTSLSLLVQAVARDNDDGTPTGATIAFLARDVPAVGYRTYRVVPSSRPLDDAGWRPADATTIENRAFAVSDPDRGGAVTSLIDKRTSKQLVQAGEVANELRVYREYPNHPLFAEGPWHLTPMAA